MTHISRDTIATIVALTQAALMLYMWWSLIGKRPAQGRVMAGAASIIVLLLCPSLLGQFDGMQLYTPFWWASFTSFWGLVSAVVMFATQSRTAS